MFAYLFFFDDTPTTEIYTLSLPTLFRSSAAIVASAFRSGNRRQSTAMGGTTERTMDCRLPPHRKERLIVRERHPPDAHETTRRRRDMRRKLTWFLGTVIVGAGAYAATLLATPSSGF